MSFNIIYLPCNEDLIQSLCILYTQDVMKISTLYDEDYYTVYLYSIYEDCPTISVAPDLIVHPIFSRPRATNLHLKD